MPRFFNLRRRKQPVVMSYIDEIKDEEVLRVVKHVRSRAGLPALPPNGGPNSSGTMKTEESDDRSVGKVGPSSQQPVKEPLALVAEVGSEVQELTQKGPCSMKEVTTTSDLKMLATPNLNIKKASSTRSWVKRASFNLTASQQQRHQDQVFMKTNKKNQKVEKPKADEADKNTTISVPKIDTTHDGNINGMDSPSRYLAFTPKTPTAVGSFFCAPSLSCADQVWPNYDPDDRTLFSAPSEGGSWISWTSRIRRAEHQMGLTFIDNVLDHIVGDDTFDGGTVMDESTIGPSMIFSPESARQRARTTPGGTSVASSSQLLTPATDASRNKSSHRIMGKLAKWDEMDKLTDDEEEESCTLFDVEDANDRTLGSQTSGSEYTSDFYTTDDEETEMTGGTETSAYTSVYTSE